MQEKFLLKVLFVLACLIILSAPRLLAQDFCEGLADYDQDVDADDVEEFLNHFGRHQFNNPCPPDGPAPVEKTGRTVCCDEEANPRDCAGTGEDGEFQMGVAWPSPRFANNGDGTVTDNLTGLIWLQNANCMGTNYPEFDNDNIAGDGLVTWQHSLDFIAGINDGTYSACGGVSPLTDWRLPNIRELHSLVDYGNAYPAISSDHPFDNFQFDSHYWSSTTLDFSSNAWSVRFEIGEVRLVSKANNEYYVWPVRGGH